MPSENDLQGLREDAESILQVWKGNEPSHPHFVEFSGTPKSGKSTCIDNVSHFFRRLGFRVLSPTEGASRRTPRYLRENLFRFNVWSASYALTHILEGLSSPEKYHIAILDRGVFDALVWFQLLADRGDVTLDDLKKVHEFFLIEEWLSAIDQVFLFRADPATSLERENADKLVVEHGTAMNPEFLEQLNSAYEKVRDDHAERFKDVRQIDTGGDRNTTPQQTAYEVARAIVDRMQGRT